MVFIQSIFDVQCDNIGLSERGEYLSMFYKISDKARNVSRLRYTISYDMTTLPHSYNVLP